MATRPRNQIPPPSTNPSHTVQPVTARHGGKLPTSTTTSPPAATTGAAYCSTFKLPRTAPADCANNASASAISSAPHTSAATRRAVPSPRKPSPTVSTPSTPNQNTPVRCRANHAEPSSASDGFTKSAVPPRGTNSRPSSPVTLHSPITTGAPNCGAASRTRAALADRAP